MPDFHLADDIPSNEELVHKEILKKNSLNSLALHDSK